MQMQSTLVNHYCSLLGDSTQWGGADILVLIHIFRSVIDEVNAAVGVVPNKPLMIQPNPGLGHPMCSKIGDVYCIFLSARKNYWSKYVYQFAHEYCHYVIDGPMDGSPETTFWFEESVCELASMYFLNRVTSRWESWNLEPASFGLGPEAIPLFMLKSFAPNNRPYLDNLLSQNPPIDAPLHEWLENNMSILSQPDYHRDMYNQIARVLYDLFSDYPDLWKVILFLQRPKKEDYSDFRSFITTTLKDRITIEIEHFPVFVECLTGAVSL